MAQELQQLFSNILTPATLTQQQEAEDQQAQQIYKNNPRQYELQRSLNKLAEQIPGSRAYQIKQKAQANQLVLNAATRSYGDSIKGGASSEDAQIAMLDHALNEFSSQGNYESISALAPSYLALQQRKAQMEKLKQESIRSEAIARKLGVEADVLPEKTKTDVAAKQATIDLSNARKAKLEEAETAQIVDLVNPKAGPIVARIDDKGNAVFTDANGQEQTRPPGQYKKAAKEATTGGAPKPISPTVIKDVRGLSQVSNQVQGLLNGLKPEFGGYKSDSVGNAVVNAKGKGLMPDKEGEAKWWADAQWLINADRHALFGSALTANESTEWDKASITKGLKNSEIKNRLEIRARIAKDVSTRTANAYKAGGHNAIAIDAITGGGETSAERAKRLLGN